MKLQSGWQTFLWRLGSIWRMLLNGGSLTRLVAGALSSLLCGPHQKAALCPSEHTVQVRVKRKPCCLLRHIVIFEISYIMWEITTQRHESQEVGITEANLEPDSYICSLQTVCVCVCMCVFSRFSHVQLFVTLWTVACQPPLSMGFSRWEHWSRLPYPPPGDLPNPGIELT